MTIYYFGTEGSNTHLAAQRLFPGEHLISSATLDDCFSAVQNDTADKAVVPLENSIEGTVSQTLDLLYQFPVSIEAEAVMPIAHQLLVHENNKEIQRIYSHPQALAQCRGFLNKNFPEAKMLDFASTSAAAKFVAENPDEPVAAVANSFAAELFGLKTLHSGIQDFEQNHTRFVVISKNPKATILELPITAEKSSLMVTLPTDHAGGLHQVLSVFAWRKMNLSKIESRTLKTGLGNYFFFINVAGNWEQLLYQNSVPELESIGAEVKFLGYYHEYFLQY